MSKIKKELLLVLPKKKTERKVGKIIVPETIRDKQVDQVGTVILAGKSSQEYDVPLKEGDEILFMHNPNHIEVDDKLLIKIEDVLLKL